MQIDSITYAPGLMMTRMMAHKAELAHEPQRMGRIEHACYAGFGQYLLITPAIAGLEAMRLRLRDNDTCLR